MIELILWEKRDLSVGFSNLTPTDLRLLNVEQI